MDPYIYQYTVGGVIFAIGMFYAGRQGYLGFSGQGLRNLVIAVGGLALFAGFQGWLQYGSMTEAPAVPYVGEASADEAGKILGTPLDYGIMISYFLAMLAIGTWFGRGQKTTKDFFFGGQRFSWWLISFSMVATTIGSYSFVKYSKVAYSHGLASSQTYLNDWFWLPLALFGWIPILYFSRVVSIPEYFERRFGRPQRHACTVLLLIYLVGYVGVNLFTMGTALEKLLGWDVFWAAVGVASISAVYVTFGGQTSVIMTDLFQGVMLLAVGLLLIFLGMDHLGGADALWENLPRGHRRAFPHFNADPSYPAVGIFWQDAVANSAMFFFLNQGLMMRLTAARTVSESRRATMANLLILMPIAAAVVASGGWVAKSLVHAGVLPPDVHPDDAFFVAADFLARPGIFGLIMAALTAALMSTVDTLITAISAIVVNDVYNVRNPEASEEQLLKVARFSAVGVTLFGIALVPVFMGFDSIYSAHGAFTAAVTPPLVITLMLGVFWRRFTPAAAWWTMVGGSVAIVASIIWPELVAPFAHGVPMKDVGDGFMAGKDQYKFMRALYGLSVCFVIGVVVTLFTRARPLEAVKGLVWGTVEDAIATYKGSAGREVESPWVHTSIVPWDKDEQNEAPSLPLVSISSTLAGELEAAAGDLLYVSDKRAWLGGLRSTHVMVGEVTSEEGRTLRMGATPWESVVASGREQQPVRLKRLY